MEFKTYQEQAKTTAVYRVALRGYIEGKDYVALGLAGEAGEVANQVKKVHRDDSTSLTPERRAAVRDELGDVLWYVAMNCSEWGFDMEEVAQENLAKLAKRMEEGKIKGDRRTGGH